jgi:hypothetical protein
MAGLNDDFFLADDSMEPKAPTATVQAFKDSTTAGEEPELRDDLDLIAVPATEEIFIRLRDLDLLRSRIHEDGGMSKSIALEAHAIMPDFLHDDRPAEFFTKMPSKTLLAAALEDIGLEQQSNVQKLLEMISSFIKQFIERINAFFGARSDEQLTDFSESTQKPQPQLINWVKAGKEAGIEVPEAKEGEEAEVTLNQVMESDDSRKKAVDSIGDKLFIRLGEKRFKSFAYVGHPNSKKAEEFIDGVRKYSKVNPTNINELKEFTDAVAELVNAYRQDEAIFEIENGTHMAREIMGDVLYLTDKGYYKEHFKFKGAAHFFKNTFLPLAEKISADIKTVRGDTDEEGVAKLRQYQESLATMQKMFQVYASISDSTDVFLKLRKQYMSADASLSSRPEV